ncbi:MAG: alpha-galactosidase [Ignavibacteriales bacterium CG_4_9_14_3_um_filter_34_10]|nr:MAG: alpha-galactosidase [Ignavibacteriales bacterium CG_4_9_14_3_um_filter_34_10]
MMIYKSLLILFFISAGLCYSFAQQDDDLILFKNDEYKISLDNDFLLKILSLKDGTAESLAYSNIFNFVLDVNENHISNFSVIDKSEEREKTQFGNSTVIYIKSANENKTLLNNFKIIIPDSFENTLIFKSDLKNNSNQSLHISKMIFCQINSDARNLGSQKSYEFWSFQPQSTPDRADWIQPISENHYQKNFQGMNAPDYGGGIPVLDIWNKNQGIAVSSLSLQPEFINFPVQALSDVIQYGIEDSIGFVLKPDEEISIFPFAIILHKGDFFNALRVYSDLIQLEGVKFKKSSQNSLEPEWCAWGYERNFNKDQIFKSLDDVVSLGLKWVTIDDGWQSADGDWGISNYKFKNGETEFKSVIDSIHSKGLKVRLWWVPFTASDSIYSAANYPDRLNEFGMVIQSNIAKQHSDWFSLDKNKNRYQVSWWNSYQLCPALKEVRDYFKAFVVKAIKDWGVDGFKIDGQNLNLAPPCYNPEHHHSSPYDASRATAIFFKEIYEIAKSINPDFLIQICPCGTNYSVYNLPYVDQVVASDPLNSWQVRVKGKTFKALFGNKVTYSGDHVELTNRKWNEHTGKFDVYKDEDFVSTIGIGGVPSTKFTNPNLLQSDSSLMLTDKKKKYWEKWLNLYNDNKLSEGNYINLYDIAFDKPETHLIKKGDDLYYSLFDDKKFNGLFEFRGLEPNINYDVYDIVADNKLGTINCKKNFLKLKFNSSTILKVSPIK